jgi:hypothetical protein
MNSNGTQVLICQCKTLTFGGRLMHEFLSDKLCMTYQMISKLSLLSNNFMHVSEFDI